MKKRIKSTTQLKIFTTLLFITIIILMYFLLISDVNSYLTKQDYASYTPRRPEIAIILIVTTILAYVASSIIIERIFNPIRLMITKVNDVGNMNFTKPLVIYSDDDELQEYVRAFNKMSDSLNIYIERQKRFISDVSHELATPITVINGHADLLQRHYMDNPKLIESELKIIKSEALKMDELVDSLLLLTRSDSNRQKYSFEYVRISKIVNDSVTEAKIVSPDFIFEVNIENDIEVKCDEYAIKRVMRILLSNAVKYSSSNQQVNIKVHESHGLINVSIKDNGIGIASEHLAKIFDRFYRVDDSRSKKTGGSGLGLAIAKEIINAHGGDIRVSSEIGNGSEFIFILSA